VAAPVAALTEGVLNAMWWTKMQALTGTVLVLAVAFGTGSWAYQASAQPVPGPGGRADAVTPRASQDRGDSHAQDELTDLLKKLAAEQQALEAQRAQLEANLKLLQQQAQAHEKQRQDVEAKLKELLRQREYRLTEDEQAKRRQKALKAVALALDELKTADPENPAVRAFEGSYQKLLASYGPPASANYAKELYYDLLKRAQEADHAERLKVYPRDPAKGPPDLEGKVLVVKDPFVVISLGAQAGLTKGAVLTAYRNGPKPVYLGRLTVVEVVADSAVCETAQGPKGKLLDGLQVGDAVTTKLLETK
jgi:Skp family chaperone for outer membrane proteins